MFNWFTHGKLERSEGSSITEGIGQGRVTANMEGAPIDDAICVLDKDAVAMVMRVFSLYFVLHKRFSSCWLNCKVYFTNGCYIVVLVPNVLHFFPNMYKPSSKTLNLYQTYLAFYQLQQQNICMHCTVVARKFCQRWTTRTYMALT